MHTNGIHTLDICYCSCANITEGASHPRVQLLHSSWLPASLDLPRTAFTFDVLSTFHLLTLQSKIAAFDYYWATSRMSDNVGTSDQKVCY
jgi:hypothetical protein